MNIFKQIIGIDVSKDSLSVVYASQDYTQTIKASSVKEFANSIQGFKKLLVWSLQQKREETLPMHFLMEATGVYYENLAYFLTDHKQSVVVVLPNKAKYFARSLEIKSKTDDLDAVMLAQLGLSRNLKQWVPPSNDLRKLKALCREYHATIKLLTQLKNRLHAKQKAYDTPKEVLAYLQLEIRSLKNIVREILADIGTLVEGTPDLRQKVKNITTIKGVGLITAASIIAETDGFAQIHNTKQLASYAGLDVVANESGTIHHRTKISKKGNSHIRQAIYMSSLSACRYNKSLKDLYVRLTIKNNIKMIGLIAVARKLLILIYTLYKKNEPFNPEYGVRIAV